MTKNNGNAVRWMKRYLRYTDYISAAQLYLKDNYFLEKPLEPKHIKERILGHWGTVPGLNLVYAGLNYLATKKKAEILMVTGPGHGAPSVLANVFAEGTMGDFYKEYPVNGKGAGKLIHDFSWPHSKFPSHVTPTVPGSILEGGELGYSLSTAYGSVMDNPNLITAVVVGDGESESGPLAAAWNSNKFLNPKTSGVVLPIVHVNGYKISNPTIYGTMSDTELRSLFKGYGYEPIIVEGMMLERKTLAAMEKAYSIIRAVQKKARAKGARNVLKPKWPVIILRSPKGWKGVHKFGGHMIEGSFHAHGIPLGNPKHDEQQLRLLEAWLKSYKVEQLMDKNGKPLPEVLAYVPKGKYRIGSNPHAIGGAMLKPLKLPKLSKYEMPCKKRGAVCGSSMIQGGKMLRDIFRLNKKNFRVFCPDELESNKLSEIFKATKRGYVWPIPKNAENVAYDGRAIEMLSEHTLQGFMQGYLLTGRHGMFASYEAFTTIITSMVDQYAKFLKQAKRVPWRKPVSTAVYLESSVGWRQDHNGYSHQNPSFVSNVLQKHGEFCQIYYPADANAMVAALEEVYKKRDSIAVIVAGKRDLPQWQSLKEARAQAKNGIGIWEWVGGKAATKSPDVVLASAGDYITQDALFAVKMCHELIPELKIRYVNVSELTSMCLGDLYGCKTSCSTEVGMNKYFTTDKPVVFSYHGYVNDLEQILWPYNSSNRFSLHGYREEGSTTTPFDIKISNGVSCYHLAIDMVEHGAKVNKKVAGKKASVIAKLKKMIAAHQAYISKYGDDPKSIKDLKW